jgi:DNA-binding CsgD family transcriptional regulator
MRLQDYFDISQAPDKTAFRRRMIDFAHGMDFPIFSAVLVVEHADRDPEFHSFANRPADFDDATDLSLVKIDPVVAQLRRSPVPFVYDQKFYVDAGAGELWENAAPYGYRTGISVALRLPGNRQFLLGLDRERDLPTDDDRVMRLLADLQMLAVHCQEAAQRFLGPVIGPADVPSLSKRELEVLKWTKEGMTAWEVGDKLNISEPTVKFHLKKTFAKLQVPSKHLAVLKAISLGLIAP